MMTWYFPQYHRAERREILGVSNFDYLAVNVVAGVPDPKPPAPDIVPGRKARALSEVWGLTPPKKPYAGRDK